MIFYIIFLIADICTIHNRLTAIDMSKEEMKEYVSTLSNFSSFANVVQLIGFWFLVFSPVGPVILTLSLGAVFLENINKPMEGSNRRIPLSYKYLQIFSSSAAFLFLILNKTIMYTELNLWSLLFSYLK